VPKLANRGAGWEVAFCVFPKVLVLETVSFPEGRRNSTYLTAGLAWAKSGDAPVAAGLLAAAPNPPNKDGEFAVAIAGAGEVAFVAAVFPKVEASGFVAVAGVTTKAGIAGAAVWADAAGCAVAGWAKREPPKRPAAGFALPNMPEVGAADAGVVVVPNRPPADRAIVVAAGVAAADDAWPPRRPGV
jgi:hypothetical protein